MGMVHRLDLLTYEEYTNQRLWFLIATTVYGILFLIAMVQNFGFVANLFAWFFSISLWFEMLSDYLNANRHLKENINEKKNTLRREICRIEDSLYGRVR